jgi:exodeoxyribonuclease VII small subunit
MAEQRFEEALDKLENIVNELENGQLSLDDAIKKYEEGMKISAFCYKKLNEIEKKVEVLLRDSSGKLKTKNLDAAEEKEASGNKTAKKRATKTKRPKGEELLF